jgi:hypothetical protein
VTAGGGGGSSDCLERFDCAGGGGLFNNFVLSVKRAARNIQSFLSSLLFHQVVVALLAATVPIDRVVEVLQSLQVVRLESVRTVLAHQAGNTKVCN